MQKDLYYCIGEQKMDLKLPIFNNYAEINHPQSQFVNPKLLKEKFKE